MRRAGPSRAREIIYTADQYDAATFERWNIVNKLVTDDAFESQTRAFAERLANGPTLAYAAGKRMVRAYLERGIGQQTRKWPRHSLGVKTCVPAWPACSSTVRVGFETRSSFEGASNHQSAWHLFV